MRSRPLVLKFLAIVLILVFSQKTGAGLFLHNLLHGNVKSIPQDKSGDQYSSIGYACSCVDDLMMPFQEEVAPGFAAMPKQYASHPSFQLAELSLILLLHQSQRGPPSFRS